MKKIMITLLFTLISFNVVNACKIKILDKEIPKNFKNNCYEFIAEEKLDIK
jgi:hypothetical protein